MSTQRKIKRQIKEIKYNFYGQSQFAIKEEICPLILSFVSNKLIEEGKVKKIILYPNLNSLNYHKNLNSVIKFFIHRME